MRIRQMGFSSRLKAHRHLLTLETLKFIVEFLVDGSAKGAAIRSGIPEQYASRQGQWLKKLAIVQRALETELDERDLRKLQAAVSEIESKIEFCRSILGIEEDELEAL
jgi:phage terminase small subunit